MGYSIALHAASLATTKPPIESIGAAMKTVLLSIIGFGMIAIRLIGFLPWTTRGSARQPSVRFTFLLVLGLVSLGAIFMWFWFAMRAH
jgi:hypothetical protein